MTDIRPDTMALDPVIRQRLLSRHQQLVADGTLPTANQLAAYTTTFRQRFGPDVLRDLDGEALLSTMHDHSNPESLVYWLEFKDDAEFPAIFGSIAGGSALKFGIYRRKETGLWMTGSPQNQRVLSLDEAIQIARRHRDQLIAGTRLLADLPSDAGEPAYRALQQAMDTHAPDVSKLSWGHKYFSLLYPEKLDDYHSPVYQRFHLVRLLQVPPAGDGQYVSAVHYVRIARNLEIPLNHLTTICNEEADGPYRYWAISTDTGDPPRNRWPLMRDGQCIAIGWPELGDLSSIEAVPSSKAALRSRFETCYPHTSQAANSLVGQIFSFVAGIQPGDLVLAGDGATFLGIGRVTGPYVFDPTSDVPHRRPVEWLVLDALTLPTQENLHAHVRQLRTFPENLVAIERRVQQAGTRPLPPPASPDQRPTLPLPPLHGIPARIDTVLERKGQIILYGPPGTGKTFWAEQTAYDLAARQLYGKPFAQIDTAERAAIVGRDADQHGVVRVCCFHPAYGYEDFLEGYRPEPANGQMRFILRDGIFKQLCRDALAQPHRRFYLIIDEINRGDIPQIFGELLTVLEKNKRGRPILLPVSGERFAVPANVYVIGTMNTADRSIALLDTALRRRFGFVELMPDSSLLGNCAVSGIPLGPWLNALNDRIRKHVGRDARNLQIGHTYLLERDQPVSDVRLFARIVQEDIIPLLEEYCYEDYDALEKILGAKLVDRQQQRIRHELFDSARQDDLIQALLAPAPEITTSPQAIASEAAQAEEEEGAHADDLGEATS